MPKLVVRENIDLNGVVYANEEIAIDQSTLIQGPNGAGKTSLIESLVNIKELNNNLKFAYTLQSSPLMFNLKQAYKRLSLANETNGKELFKELVKQFKFRKYIRKSPKKLSDGQRKMANIILNLSTKADFHILDEPLNGLDKHKANLLQKILKETDVLLIVISHRSETRSLFKNKITIENKVIKYD